MQGSSAYPKDRFQDGDLLIIKKGGYSIFSGIFSPRIHGSDEYMQNPDVTFHPTGSTIHDINLRLELEKESSDISEDSIDSNFWEKLYEYDTTAFQLGEDFIKKRQEQYTNLLGMATCRISKEALDEITSKLLNRHKAKEFDLLCQRYIDSDIVGSSELLTRICKIASADHVLAKRLPDVRRAHMQNVKKRSKRVLQREETNSKNTHDTQTN